MRFSVVICTRNRADRLQRALQSIAQCERPVDDRNWELLVVDNGCTDHTREVANASKAFLPLRIVDEEKVGLSNARNRGVAAARGQWLLWTDDDVMVDRQWLTQYFAAMSRYPDAHVFGGPVAIRFEGNPPGWLVEGLEQIRSAYAERGPYDVEPMLRPDGPLPYGANFALRRLVAQKFPFDPRLGRHPDRPTRGWEETFVIRGILAAKGVGRWVPDARVVHHIDNTRQTSAYLRSYYFDIGFVHAMDLGSRRRRAFAIKQLVNAIYAAVTNDLKYGAQTLIGRRSNRAVSLREAAESWGRAKGSVRLLAHHLRGRPWGQLPL